MPYPASRKLIVNYERLPNMVSTLGRWLTERPSMIILDEAHRMKLAADGAYGAACLALGPRAGRRLILTGTPAPNGAKDLENLFGFVWPGTGRQSVIRAVDGGAWPTPAARFSLSSPGRRRASSTYRLLRRP